MPCPSKTGDSAGANIHAAADPCIAKDTASASTLAGAVYNKLHAAMHLVMRAVMVR